MVWLYTFRTYPKIEQLKKIGDVTVLGSLKKDIEELCNRLLAVEPEYILGVADMKRKSVMEPLAINKIHKGIINKAGLKELKLFVPSPTLFEVSVNPTHTFCNYSMYKIAEFIEKSNLKTKLMFVHLNGKDEQKIGTFVTGLIN